MPVRRRGTGSTPGKGDGTPGQSTTHGDTHDDPRGDSTHEGTHAHTRAQTDGVTAEPPRISIPGAAGGGGRAKRRASKDGDDVVSPEAAGGGHDTPTARFEQVKAHPRWRFLADNEAIHTGYRYGLTCRQAARSLFTLHNETMNVWTHAVGSITFVVLFINLLAGGISPMPAPSDAVASVDFARMDAQHVQMWCDVAHNATAPNAPPTASLQTFIECCDCNSSSARLIGECTAYPADDTCRCICSKHDINERHHVLSSYEHALLHATQLAEHAQQSVRALFDETASAAESPGWNDARDRLEKSVHHMQHALDSFADVRDRVVETAASLQGQARSSLSQVRSSVARAAEALQEHASSLTEDLQSLPDAVRQRMPDGLLQTVSTTRDKLRQYRAAAKRLLDPDQFVDGRAHTSRDAEGTPVPQWPMAVFIASAMICMGASAIFHLFHVVSETFFSVLVRVDYASITLLIAGSSAPPLYYAYYCMPTLLRVYLFFSWLTCGTTLVLGLSEKFRSSAWRVPRTLAYVVTGCYGLIPFGHLLFISGKQYEDALFGLLFMGFLYISGAMLYGFRFPERLFPGKFDLFFASHQIFHMCVFAACVVHYVTVVSHYQWRVAHDVCEN